ncbi:YmfQ family protein [Pseudogulbenkiania ferrooxidans]|uniref:DUF2313 domain-containing protein n=1 Tax=Pseudogulbenkiania ferrooxidans 2002 TaxID=279714 RepID=B9Z4Y7_9NEIS|nr:putative phage tail protein [Pseudogulbenkiania ferrooxidans]EEG08219.1 conserved hypothetical protein [Pseudogulbenkiania ferrooxidans 2002]
MNQDRYADQLAKLLPPGQALQAEPGSDMAIVLGSIATFLAEVDTRASILLAESDPRQAVYLLDEWEASLGLPDSCTVGEQTIIDRQKSVVAKLTDRGGARVTRYIKLAEALGYPGATVTRYRSHTCEQTCEDPIQDEDWRFAWTLTLPSGTRVVDSTCESSCEDPLRTWGDSVLECVIQREAPAISTALIAYGGN